MNALSPRFGDNVLSSSMFRLIRSLGSLDDHGAVTALVHDEQRLRLVARYP